jgi:hypothetical protein
MGWVVNATHRPLYPRERDPVTHCIGGWVGCRTGLDGLEKFRSHRDYIPGPSSPFRVDIPTELSRPIIIIVNLQHIANCGQLNRPNTALAGIPGTDVHIEIFRSSWNFAITHFNAIVSNFRDWSRWIRMRPRGVRHCRAITKIALISVTLSL